MVGDDVCCLLGTVNDTEMQEHYDEFFEEVFTELEDKVCSPSESSTTICSFSFHWLGQVSKGESLWIAATGLVCRVHFVSPKQPTFNDVIIISHNVFDKSYNVVAV